MKMLRNDKFQIISEECDGVKISYNEKKVRELSLSFSLSLSLSLTLGG